MSSRARRVWWRLLTWYEGRHHQQAPAEYRDRGWPSSR